MLLLLSFFFFCRCAFSSSWVCSRATTERGDLSKTDPRWPRTNFALEWNCSKRFEKGKEFTESFKDTSARGKYLESPIESISENLLPSHRWFLWNVDSIYSILEIGRRQWWRRRRVYYVKTIWQRRRRRRMCISQCGKEWCGRFFSAVSKIAHIGFSKGGAQVSEHWIFACNYVLHQRRVWFLKI